MTEGIMLDQIIKLLVGSGRIIIQEEDGKELYRGFVACYEYSKIEEEMEVVGIKLCADIFKKKNRDLRLPWETEEAVPVEHITDFRFSDLDMLIYKKITVRKIRVPGLNKENYHEP